MDKALIELVILLSALLLGTIFGFACQRSRFCFLGIVSDLYIYRSTGRLILYLVTLTTAVVGVEILTWLVLINPNDSIYYFVNDQTICKHADAFV